jgi:transposase
MEFSAEQSAELKQAGHRHPKAGVRVKALAVLAVARGSSFTAVAEMFDATYHSVSTWVHRYLDQGLAAFEVAPGRGRPPQVDDQELLAYAQQSPRQFGYKCSRWTLDLLAQTVPSLRGFTPAGVRQALLRCGLSYKRGQAWLSSPDPDFEKKS